MEEIKLKGAILILSGPSGAGKSSLYKALAKEFPRHYFSISSTTREKRKGEEEGVHYHFISKEEFQKNIQENNFLEWALVHGNYYGTSKMPILEALEQGKLVIFDVDVQGQENIKKAFPNHTTSVFVTTNSKKILEERLGVRGSDENEIIKRRLENAAGEVKKLDKFDYLVINENLEESAKTLVCIAKVAFCRASLYPIDLVMQKWEQ
ncbi:MULTISPECIES: guanylate kinase [Helicobacter]|uniref:Guanylate kinase n=1 Tax=Helicobacter colisuis TaxID=2949739 RepID=A0ABT0TSR9_9HELI|nr:MULTISPECIES: guanylate kinase [Helicobacter]MCI2236605.1 guanylate kinase [Helicobacter sp. CaF467b]MCI7765100.1 guanylate kinase [Helicobacter sp.]MCL9818972.1 guanylate kinase [Helicobacter colisuis]MCL9820762.1 guanylate kinase [Helicobacter colisuis]MCL9822018.1 guanylate kinase [Helicobacter colisuis]